MLVRFVPVLFALTLLSACTTTPAAREDGIDPGITPLTLEQHRQIEE